MVTFIVNTISAPSPLYHLSSLFFLVKQQQLSAEGLAYNTEPLQWALLQFQHSVYCPIGSLIIGSRLDTDTSDHPGSSNNNNSNSGGSAGKEKEGGAWKLYILSLLYVIFNCHNTQILYTNGYIFSLSILLW